MSIDTKLIFVFIAALVFVLFKDDGAAQRWCDTYRFSKSKKSTQRMIMNKSRMFISNLLFFFESGFHSE